MSKMTTEEERAMTESAIQCSYFLFNSQIDLKYQVGHSLNSFQYFNLAIIYISDLLYLCMYILLQYNAVDNNYRLFF